MSKQLEKAPIAWVFVNHGETVMTCQFFPKGGDYGVSACASGLARITALESYIIG